jgi:hypothetical protein
MLRGVLGVGSLVPPLAGIAVACAAHPAALSGEPVTAPVACVELPAPTPLPAAPSESTSASPAPQTQASSPAPRDSSVTTPSAHSDPCEPPCTGDTICWVYVHRTRSGASAAAIPADGGWPTALFAPDDDTGVSRRETRCLPSSARCPPDANGTSARVTIVNGVVSKWNTCTWYDGP